MELASKLSPEDEVETDKKDNKFNAISMIMFLIFGMAGAVYTVDTVEFDNDHQLWYIGLEEGTTYKHLNRRSKQCTMHQDKNA